MMVTTKLDPVEFLACANLCLFFNFRPFLSIFCPA